MSDDIYKATDFPMPPSGIDFTRFTVKHDAARNSASITCPVLLQSSFELVNPTDNVHKPGTQKWTGGFCIPKVAGAPLLAALKKVSDEMMKLDGAKGAYPNAIKDGAAKDGSGLYVKAGGKWSEFAYFSAKSYRCPTFTKKDQNGALIEIPANELVQGTYGILLLDLIVVSHGGQGGAGGKRGTSAWMSRYHQVGGGMPIGGGAGRDESDFMSMIDAAAANADSPVTSEDDSNNFF